MKLRFILGICCALLVIDAEAQSLYHGISLEYGPHAVGFRQSTETDRSRTYERTMDYPDQLTFREMPVSIWYPLADTTGAKPVYIADYLRILKEEEEWECLPDEYFFSWFYYPETEAGVANAASRTKAFTDGVHLSGAHPVVIYAPSFNASSAENFLLCEYLASKGYVVLSTPSRGSFTRSLERGILRDAETQRRDLEFLVGHASTLPFADVNRLFTIGFSFGGLSNVLFAMNNPHVDGVISLDGTIQYRPELPRTSPFYRPAAFKVPFVHISQKDIPEAVIKADNIDPELGKPFIFFDSLSRAPAYHFQHTALTHGQFAPPICTTALPRLTSTRGGWTRPNTILSGLWRFIPVIQMQLSVLENFGSDGRKYKCDPIGLVRGRDKYWKIISPSLRGTSNYTDNTIHFQL